MYVNSEAHQIIYGVGLLKVLKKAIQQLVKCFQSVVPEVGLHATVLLLDSCNPTPHVKLKINQSIVDSKIRLKESYLVTTVLSELVRNHSRPYHLAVAGHGMRGRLLQMICPMGACRFFEKGQ